MFEINYQLETENENELVMIFSKLEYESSCDYKKMLELITDKQYAEELNINQEKIEYLTLKIENKIHTELYKTKQPTIAWPRPLDKPEQQKDWTEIKIEGPFDDTVIKFNIDKNGKLDILLLTYSDNGISKHWADGNHISRSTNLGNDIHDAIIEYAEKNRIRDERRKYVTNEVETLSKAPYSFMLDGKLRNEMKYTGISMSKFTNKAIEEKLERDFGFVYNENETSLSQKIKKYVK